MACSGILNRGLATALVGALCVLGPAIAGVTPVAMAQSQMPQIALNAKIVDAFIKSYPVVKQTADGVSKKYKIKTEGGSASGWGAWMGATAAWAEMNGVVKSYGFDSFESWLNATISVATAYGFAKDGGQMDTSMADAVKQIQSDPNIPAAQKQMMLQQIQQSAGAVAAMRPPQANIDAVKPYLAKLAEVFDD